MKIRTLGLLSVLVLTVPTYRSCRSSSPPRIAVQYSFVQVSAAYHNHPPGAMGRPTIKASCHKPGIHSSEARILCRFDSVWDPGRERSAACSARTFDTHPIGPHGPAPHYSRTPSARTHNRSLWQYRALQMVGYGPSRIDNPAKATLQLP
jgi:hypothetical protein